MPHVQDPSRFVLAVLGLVAGLILAGPGSMRAQEPGPSVQPFDLFGQGPKYITKQWTVEDGLPLNVVWTLAQTQDGMLWAGTLDGLARFDGHSFTTYTAANTDGLAGNRIYELFEDTRGTLWIGTATGVSTYRDGHVQTVKGVSGHIEQIVEGPGRTVWMGGRAGLFRRPPGKEPSSLSLPDALRGGDVRVAAEGPGSVWVASGRHLRLYHDGTFHEPAALDGSIEGTIFELENLSNGPLWVATDSAVHAVRDGPDRTIPHEGGPVTELRGTPSGTVWLTTSRAGLLRVAEGGVQHVSMQGTLGTKLRGLTRDERGQWWVGDHGRGLVRLRPRLFSAVTGGVPGGSTARSVYADDEGTVWAGVGKNQLFRFADSTQSRWTPADGLPEGKVRSIGQDGEGRLWVGTWRGLARQRETRFEELKMPDGTSFEKVWALYRDPTNALWIAPVGQGLYRYRNEDIERVLSADRLREARVLGLHRATDGTLWLGTQEHGVATWANGTLTWYDGDDGVPYKSVRDIYETDDGTIWISTSGGGVARFEGDHFTPVTPRDGLPHRSIHLIREVPEGVFWMTANGGVFRVQRSQLEAVADGRRDRLYAQTFGMGDGMPARECNGPIHPAFGKDGQDRLWIPTVDGLAVVDSRSPQLSVPHSLPVRVTALRSDGDPLPLDSLRLAPSTYRVALDFTAVSLRHADDLSFRYRLDGETWTSAHGRRTAEFTSLGAGTHRFEVQATVNGEQWYTLGSPFRFTIAPHFYETWWFHLLVVLGVIGLAVGIYRWRTVRLRKRQEELENAVDERTRQLQARTEELAEEKEKTERQAEKLAELDEAKNRFFAHVSHEFRTPLSLILSPLEESLRHAEALGTEQKQRMVDNARRLQRLIDQLLDLATLEAGRMELERQPGDLASVVERSAEAFRSKAEQKEIDLRVERPEGRIETRFDPEKVETIVSNLVGNAVKFTPTGGTVTIHVEATESTAPVEAPGEAESAQGTAVIEVDDTGPGIDPAVQETIFDRFEQADTSTTRAHEGTGLGLALTSELVELHGGTIDVDSAPGEGATFAVQLPVVPVAEASMGARERGSTRARGSTGDGEQESVGEGERERGGEGARERGGEGAREHGRVGDGERGGVGDGERGRVGARETESVGEREHGSVGERERGGDGREQSEREAEETSEAEATILVVEDNAEMRAYLREQFAERWAVIEAADGEAGWQRVQEDEPDLVLSDVMMPALDGFELCRRIKTDEEFRTIPVLLLTARAGEEATREGLRCGADDYVAKPFDAQELRQRIANHLAARRHLQARYRTEVDLGTAVVDEADRPFVEEFLETIDDHLGNPDLTVGDLADEMALSRRQLTRRVKRTTGEAPGTVLRTHRIERAKAMLERDPETIAEVAYAVGFQSSSAFSRSFREHVGTSPSTYVEEQGS